MLFTKNKIINMNIVIMIYLEVSIKQKEYDRSLHLAQVGRESEF